MIARWCGALASPVLAPIRRCLRALFPCACLCFLRVCTGRVWMRVRKASSSRPQSALRTGTPNPNPNPVSNRSLGWRGG